MEPWILLSARKSRNRMLSVQFIMDHAAMIWITLASPQWIIYKRSKVVIVLWANQSWESRDLNPNEM